MARSRKRIKPKYKVNVAMQAWDLAKVGAAITLNIKDRTGLLGTIEVGQGSLRWRAAYTHKFKRIPWQRLADVLDTL